MSKHLVFFFIILLLTACAALPENVAVAPVPTRIAATNVPTIVPTVPTTAEKFVPKHKNLIFIEFFAIT